MGIFRYHCQSLDRLDNTCHLLATSFVLQILVGFRHRHDLVIENGLGAWPEAPVTLPLWPEAPVTFPPLQWGSHCKNISRSILGTTEIKIGKSLWIIF